MTSLITAGGYPYTRYLPRILPVKPWEPFQEQEVIERGLLADPEKKSLLSAAETVKNLTPDIGTEIIGFDLRQLSDSQKNELALLVAERGVVFFRDQEFDIYEQLDLSRYFGPLLKDAYTPREEGLEEVHVVYTRGVHYDDISPREEWHADKSTETQPPGITTLKILYGPESGGDTLWSSGYALYSSLSPGLQKYLEGFSALHSLVLPPEAKAENRIIEATHPVVRVHPATGWKSIFVNEYATKRILGIPKAESDAILEFLFTQAATNPAFQVRFQWKPNSIAFWDNRVVTHSAIRDVDQPRHGLRTTPHAEKPMSVKDYETRTGKFAKDRKLDLRKDKRLDATH